MPHPTTEQLLVCALITEPDKLDLVRSIFPTRRIKDGRAAQCLEAIESLVDEGQEVSLPAIDSWIGLHPRDDGFRDTAEFVEWYGDPLDPGSAERWAHRCAYDCRLGDVGRLSDAVAAQPDDKLARAQLAYAIEELKSATGKRPGIPVEELGVAEDHLLDEEDPPEILPGILIPNHVSLLVGDAMAGKSSFQAIVAMAIAKGCSPWNGAPVMTQGRILVITPDDSYRTLRRKYRRLSISHFKDLRHDWAANVDILALGEKVPVSRWEKLKLDADGVAIITQTLEAAARDEKPYKGVILDALIDFLPIGASENSNEDMARALQFAEALAASQPSGFFVWATHHSGKVPQEMADDVKASTRGASAIVGKARCVALMQVDKQDLTTRILHSQVNEGDPIRPLMLEVCLPDRAERKAVDYFHPGTTTTTLPTDLIAGEEQISMTELGFRLWDKHNDDGERPGRLPGSFQRRSRDLVAGWEKAGLVEITRGKRKSKLVGLSAPQCTLSAPGEGVEYTRPPGDSSAPCAPTAPVTKQARVGGALGAPPAVTSGAVHPTSDEGVWTDTQGDESDPFEADSGEEPIL